MGATAAGPVVCAVPGVVRVSDQLAVPDAMPPDRQVDWQLVQRTLAGDQKAFE